MRIRIRLEEGPQFQPRRGKNRRLAGALAALLTPVAVMAAVLGLWRILSDMGWTGEFAISQGIFSHWQVWVALAALIEAVSILLNRYGSRKESVQAARAGTRPTTAEISKLPPLKEFSKRNR